MAADPFKYFRLEARELLDQFDASILELERGAEGAAHVQKLLRVAHTLKGAARVVRQNEIAERSHAIEDELSSFRDAEGVVPPERIRAVRGYLEDIAGHVLALSADARDAPTPGAPTPVAADDETFRTVRADVAEMDALLEGVSETHTILNGLRPAALAIEQTRHLADLLLEQLGRRGRAEQAPDRARATAEDLRRRLGGVERTLGGAIEQMDRELRQLRQSAEQLRLLPADVLFRVLERTALDAAQALGKTVVFEGLGGAFRLDAYVLGAVQAALVQIVRNAVAHGVETPAARTAAGKDAAGRVSVEISRRGREVIFECRDDGRGLDLEAVRRAAASKDAKPRTQRLGDEELIELLLRGGITTSEAVTEVAGRGVGLDVVREAVGKLGARLTCRTQAGAGTAFDIVAPLSLAAVDALVVEAGGTRASIPFDAVRRSMRVASDEISRTAAGATVIYELAAIPFLPLSDALGGAPAPADRTWPVVVTAGAEGLAALGVDRLLGAARIVVRPLPDLAPASAVIAGASLDADGAPQLVLDPDGLVAEARRGKSRFQPTAARRPVLIIDDSLTTRMLEQSILESAGFEVELAQSAEEGLEKARRRTYALFLVDVEMPGMDGFAFVERVRGDPGLRETPAILVTSRNAPEDLQRGRDAGAQGYVVKSEFDQAELLAMIRRLIE